MAENAARLTPKFAITVIVLLTMATLCMMKFENEPLRLDLIRSKPFLAGAGMLTAFMGIMSGIGFFLLTGNKWPELAVVVPFLIISIGIDDMFIMAAAWDNSDSSLSVRKRIQIGMSEAAVAITITSLTGALSFAVGCVTNIPSVRGFCMLAAICICFNYLYQVTIFAGLMVLSGAWEEERRNAFVPFLTNKRIQPQPNSTEFGLDIKNKEDWIKQQICSSRTTSVVSVHQHTLSSTFIRNIFGPFLLNPFVKIFVFFIFVCYIGVAIWGCFNIVEGLKYEKLLLADNPTAINLAHERNKKFP